MWRTIRHYAYALEHRADLLREIRWLKRRGVRMPPGIAREIWVDPSQVGPYIRFLRFIQPDENILLLDVGGNIGQWCETFLGFFPKTTVMGFEPVPEVFQQYKNRFLRNPGVRAFQVALSDRAGEASIHVGEALGLSSLTEYSPALKPLGVRFSRTEMVVLDTLDRYDLRSAQAGKTFLKIDVQGHELHVLQGAKNSLARVDIVFVECSFAQEYREEPPSFAHITKLLVDFDFYPIVFGSHGHCLSPYGWERDVTFVKRPLLDKIWGEG